MFNNSKKTYLIVRENLNKRELIGMSIFFIFSWELFSFLINFQLMENNISSYLKTLFLLICICFTIASFINAKDKNKSGINILLETMGILFLFSIYYSIFFVLIPYLFRIFSFSF